MIEVNTRAEYDYLVSRGYQPLKDWRTFRMNFKLREQIQFDLFGSGDFTKQNDKFYHMVWNHSLHNCAECGQPLFDYSSVYISHIISRGSDRGLAIDLRNANVLCYKHHKFWESQYNYKMNIYRQNQIVIRLLKNDYLCM